MVEWHSLEGLALGTDINVKVSHVISGIYLWEFVTSLRFDWDFLTLKKRFRWPHVGYFFNRYFMLVAIILNLMVVNNQENFSENQCRWMEMTLTFFASAAIGLANINMAIRAIAIWGKSLYINLLLGLLITGHWVIIMFVTYSSRNVTHVEGTCLPSEGMLRWETALFGYATAFDLIVLFLNVFKLVSTERAMTVAYGLFPQSRSRVVHLLFTQGLAYFVIACLANVAAIVFMILNLNAIMNIIFAFPAATFATIIACRSVRSLTNHGYNTAADVTRFNTIKSHHREAAPVDNSFHSSLDRKKLSSSTIKDELVKNHLQPVGVLVHMETLVQTDAELPASPARSVSGISSDDRSMV